MTSQPIQNNNEPIMASDIRVGTSLLSEFDAYKAMRLLNEVGLYPLHGYDVNIIYHDRHASVPISVDDISPDMVMGYFTTSNHEHNIIDYIDMLDKYKNTQVSLDDTTIKRMVEMLEVLSPGTDPKVAIPSTIDMSSVVAELIASVTSQIRIDRRSIMQRNDGWMDNIVSRLISTGLWMAHVITYSASAADYIWMLRRYECQMDNISSKIKMPSVYIKELEGYRERLIVVKHAKGKVKIYSQSPMFASGGGAFSDSMLTYCGSYKYKSADPDRIAQDYMTSSLTRQYSNTTVSEMCQVSLAYISLIQEESGMTLQDMHPATTISWQIDHLSRGVIEFTEPSCMKLNVLAMAKNTTINVTYIDNKNGEMCVRGDVNAPWVPVTNLFPRSYPPTDTWDYSKIASYRGIHPINRNHS